MGPCVRTKRHITIVGFVVIAIRPTRGGARGADTILVIDDDAETRKIMCLVLARAGYTVVDAQDGVQGLRLFHDTDPALVVTNIFMPEREGLELLRLIRRSSRVPIVVVSGGSLGTSLDVFSLARTFGAALTLRKPFEIDEFVDGVRGLLDHGQGAR